MNKHRAYWSVMGYEPSEEPRAIDIRRAKDKEQLKCMINGYNGDGFNEIVTLLREIKEESEGEE